MKGKSLGISILPLSLLFLSTMIAHQDVCSRLRWRINEEQEDVTESCSSGGRRNAYICSEAKIALEESWQQYYTLCPHKAGRSCSDLYKNGVRVDGVYIIDPDGKGQIKVRCDMKTDGGGWTVFQRRMNGSVDFYRNWDDYKNGFGNLNGEFWLGLENIHRLTINSDCSLRVDLENYEGEKRFAKYMAFFVGRESYNYPLLYGCAQGDAGQGLYGVRFFTTKDRDNDEWNDGNCAVKLHGGWWYSRHVCGRSNLNGKYQRNNSDVKGIYWDRSGPPYHPSKKIEMKLGTRKNPIIYCN